MMDGKTIVILNNNFFGSYCSNQYFYNEICLALENLGKKFITVRQLCEAIEVFQSNDVLFSLCLGRYEYFEDKVPLYEKYADIVVDQEGKDLEASLELLLETLKEKAK